MATEADLIQKFKDLNIPVGTDFEELIHEAFVGANLVDKVDNHDSRIATLENDLSATKGSVQAKVTDNKDGTEQLNGVQVQPFNKLSDTIGGRNLLINTAQLNDSTVCLDNKSNISDTYLGLNIYQVTNPWDGVRIYWSYLVPKLKTNTNYVMSEYVRNTSPTTSVSIVMWGGDKINEEFVFNSPINYVFATLPPNSGWTKISALVNVASFSTKTSSKLCFENASFPTDGVVQFAGIKLEQGSIATDWTPAPEDKADDSKVAHLSGANNFDTIPTVNNNPLLLASSLPSDLARTSQQTNFTAGLQSNGTAVATQTDVTTAVNTATENMADTTKATNFTAGLKSGGVDVATAADLKSVADKAWHMKGLPDTPALKNISLLYQVNDTNKKMNIVLNGKYRSATAGDSTKLLIADLSDIIQGITAISMKNNTNESGFYYYDQSMQQSPNVENHVNIVFSGTKLYMNTGSTSYPILQISGADYLCLMYGSTISYTELV